MANLHDEVESIKNKIGEVDEMLKKHKEFLKFFKNSPVITGYASKKMELNDNLDVVKLIGRIKALENKVDTLEGYHP